MGQFNSCTNCMVEIFYQFFQNEQGQQLDNSFMDWKIFLQQECDELSQCEWAQALKNELYAFKSKPPPKIMQEFKQIILFYQNSIGIEDTANQFVEKKEVLESFINSSHENDSSSSVSFAFHEDLTLKKMIQFEPKRKQHLLKQFEQYVQIMRFLKINIKDTELKSVLMIFVSLFNYQEQQLVQCLFDIQQFSRIFAGCVLRYFDIKHSSENLISEENILNFSVSLISEQVYSILYQQILMHLGNKVKETSQLIAQFYDSPGTIFGVSPKYLLNEYNDDKDTVSQPYAMSIQSLKKLREKHSPASKLKVIIKTAQRILKSIRIYYQNQNEKLDSEDLLPILTYILVKSQLFDIDVHIFLIEKLATNKLLYDTSGYYLVSLQAASESLRFIKI